MKKVAAVVVTYNRKKLLLENIQSLLLQSKKYVLDIFIIDNDSTDGTKEALANFLNDHSINYINTGTNLGGAGGFHYGIKTVSRLDYDFVWVMDDDCMPTSTALEEFLRADKILEGNYGFLSSKVLWKDGNICNMNIQRKTMFRNLKDFDSNIQQVVMASFVSLFVPVKVIREMGLPIKEFFIWTDDWEYTRRISLKYSCFFIPHSIVIHKSNSNIGANIVNDDIARLDRYTYLYRNDVYLYRREGVSGYFYEVVRLSVHMIKVILKSNDNKVARLSKIVKGTINGFCFNPEIEFIESKV